MQSRRNLIAKKISVPSKLGGRHLRTYWVRSGSNQSLRLRRAKANTHQDRPPTLSSKASLHQWFLARQFPANDRQLRMLGVFFQKPDGTSINGDDLNAFLPNPGKREIDELRLVMGPEGKSIRDKNSDEYIVEPVLDSDGKPARKTVDLSWKVERIDIKGDSVVISAQLMNAGPPVASIGRTLRTFTKQSDGSTTVSHDLLKIDPVYGGAGIGASLIKSQIASYPQLGVKKVEVGTAWVGRYTWATMGFQMAEDDRARSSRQFEKFAEQQTGDHRGGGFAYVPKGTPPLLKPDQTPYTKEELIGIYNFASPKTWEAASAAIKVYDPVEKKVTTRKLGKEFLLSENSDSWSGHIDLKPGDEHYERMRSYLGMKGEAMPASTTKTPRGVGYQALDRQEEAREAEQSRLIAVGLSRPLPVPAGVFDDLTSRGDTNDNFIRRKEMAARAIDYTISKARREAALQEIELLNQEADIALANEALEAAISRGVGPRDLYRAKAEREEIAVLRDVARDKWAKAWREVDAEAASGKPRPEELSADEKKNQDAQRVNRNMQAAEDEIRGRRKTLQQLQASGASATQIEQARQELAVASEVAGRLHMLASGVPFDEQEEEEIRTVNKGVEASRKLGVGLQALARVRRQISQEEKDLKPRAFQTTDDRRVLVENHRVATSMREEALRRVAAVEARAGTPEEIRAARMQVTIASNVLAQATAAKSRAPETADEAVRMMARQRLIQDGSGVPTSVRALHRAVTKA